MPIGFEARAFPLCHYLFVRDCDFCTSICNTAFYSPKFINTPDVSIYLYVAARALRTKKSG